MNAEIIAIGTELMLGSTVDTNSAWLAQTLATVGVGVQRITLIGDDFQPLVEVIREAWQRSELVICTGGLGPTADDLTREAVAEALNRPLEFHQDLLDDIAARFAKFGRTMSDSNRQQAFVPHGATPIRNARGTAPSFIIDETNRMLMVFPGVPSEMKFLVETELLPYLRNQRGLTSVLLMRSIRLTGTSEAEAGEIIADLMKAPYPTVGISAKAAQYEVRIAAQGNDPDKVKADLDATAAEVSRRLSKYLFDSAGLAAHVLRQFSQRNLTLALYEGLREAPVHAGLRTAPTLLTPLRGVTIHPLDEPVDAQAAETLARAAAHQVRDDWQADYGLAVVPADVTDDTWSDVCIVLQTSDGERVFHRRIDRASPDSLGFVTTAALDLLRRTLERA